MWDMPQCAARFRDLDEARLGAQLDPRAVQGELQPPTRFRFPLMTKYAVLSDLSSVLEVLPDGFGCRMATTEAENKASNSSSPLSEGAFAWRRRGLSAERFWREAQYGRVRRAWKEDSERLKGLSSSAVRGSPSSSPQLRLEATRCWLDKIVIGHLTWMQLARPLSKFHKQLAVCASRSSKARSYARLPRLCRKGFGFQSFPCPLPICAPHHVAAAQPRRGASFDWSPAGRRTQRPLPALKHSLGFR